MIGCETAEDLLPLYCDGMASAESVKLVQAHLHICPGCRKKLRQMQKEAGKSYLFPGGDAGEFGALTRRIRARRRRSAAAFSLVALSAVYFGVRLLTAGKQTGRNLE